MNPMTTSTKGMTDGRSAPEPEEFKAVHPGTQQPLEWS